jgi:hypothetical protein
VPHLERGIFEEEGYDVLGQVDQGELPFPHTQVQDTKNRKEFYLSQFSTVLWIRGTDLRIRILLRILLFPSGTFKMPTKKNFSLSFMAYRY